MNEIEKLYKLAGVETNPYCCDTSCGEPTERCKECADYREVYPPFTAEKELKLIKWFAHSGHFSHQTDYLPWIVDNIARNINFLWEVLTEEEKQQIKEILK